MEEKLSKRPNGSRRLVTTSKMASLTEQSHEKKCNINNIMARYRKTGELPLSRKSPLFGNFVGASDFQESVNIILKANEDFAKLPARIRNRFDNDPAELVQFISDPENLEEAIELGIIEKPAKVEVLSETPPVNTDLKSEDKPPGKDMEG